MTPQTVQGLAQTWSKCPHRLPAKFHIPKRLHPLTPLQHTVKLFRNCLQNIEHCFYFSNHCLVCATTFFLYIYFIFFSVIVVVVWKVWQMIWTCCVHGPETKISECGFFVVDCECNCFLSSILDFASVFVPTDLTLCNKMQPERKRYHSFEPETTSQAMV